MPAELAWTRELPTKEGLYAWRDDWGEDTAVGSLLIVTEWQGQLVAGEAFGNGAYQCMFCQDPIADYAGGEFLGPLPE